MPPTADPASKAVTSCPARESARTAASPDVPVPITQTLRREPPTCTPLLRFSVHIQVDGDERPGREPELLQSSDPGARRPAARVRDMVTRPDRMMSGSRFVGSSPTFELPD